MIIVAGPLQGRQLKFSEHDTLIFGRAHDCKVRLSTEDPTVSRHHFLLEVNPPHARLRDLNSRNGTYVNDVKCGGRQLPNVGAKSAFANNNEIDLKDGDRIRVGTTVFAVSINDDYRMADTVLAQEPVLVQTTLCVICGEPASRGLKNEQHGDHICRFSEETFNDDFTLRMLSESAIESPASNKEDPNIPGYTLHSQLGKGGMGEVYLAQRNLDGEFVAVKVMRSKIAVDDRLQKVFEREISITESLSHPNIVRVIDRASVGKHFYFVMEYCRGGSLREYSEKRGRLPIAEALSLMMPVLDGLAYAHAQGYVHRDIKPENILLTGEANEVVKLSDFGLAKSFENAGLSGMTTTGDIGGTLVFMARDQLIDFRYAKPPSDVWSLAATFYFLLSQSYPRDFPNDRDPIGVILDDPIVPILKREPGIPPALAAVVDRALNDEVSERYRNAAEFREALTQMTPAIAK